MITAHTLSLAAFQPDIPQNTGAFMRLCTGFNMSLEIIEPCGFVWDERKIKQSALDYFSHVKLTRHASWEKFLESVGTRRIVLVENLGNVQPYTEFSFRPDDILLMGRESCGVPDFVHDRADACLIIPMSPSMRSFNVAMAAAIVCSEAIRQLSD